MNSSQAMSFQGGYFKGRLTPADELGWLPSQLTVPETLGLSLFLSGLFDALSISTLPCHLNAKQSL